MPKEELMEEMIKGRMKLIKKMNTKNMSVK